MNIFEKLDDLLESIKLNESKIKKKKDIIYDDIPISKEMETSEQAKDFVREYFKKIIEGDTKDKDGAGSTPTDIPATPPPPPVSTPIDDGGDESKNWETESLVWDDDDETLKSLKMEFDYDDDDDDVDSKISDEERYDDFMDKPSKKKGGGGGRGEGGRGEDGDDNDDTYEGDSTTGDDGGERSDDYTDDETGGGGESSSDKTDGDSSDDTGGDKSSSRKSTDDTESSSGKDDDSGERSDDYTDDETEGSGESSSDKTGGSSGDDTDGDGSSSGEFTDGRDDTETRGTDDTESSSDKSSDDGMKIDGTETDGTESSSGKDDDGMKIDGTDGTSMESMSDDELKSAIKDCIDELKERHESEKSSLNELTDMLNDDSTTTENIDDKKKEIDEKDELSKSRMDKLNSLVGRLEDSISKEDMEKEIEASKLSDEEIDELKKATIDTASTDTLPKGEELDTIKKDAMNELDKKCNGDSKLSDSILYHSLKATKIDDADWKIIMEKILKNKSKNSENGDAKSKKIRLGDKNHIWRGDVRYGYKKVRGGNSEVQSIYCFIDYSGSVSSQPGLIMSFIGKVIEICEKLNYTDLKLYTFGDILSTPMVINKKMLNEYGEEKVLTKSIEFFNLRENYVGGSIENFSVVAYEINKIKKEDKNAIIFIFGDGMWTFYGNTEPPTRLKEICPRWINDIVPFIFFIKTEKWYKELLGKEISLLKDIVGISDIIVTQAAKME